MRRRFTYVAVLTIALLSAAACGADSSSPGETSSGGGGGPTLTITAPADGATVTSPFMLKFQSSEQLGKSDTGMDHVHVFADGKTDQYTVVPTNSFEMKNLSPGEHKIGVTLQHADHSPAGASAEITVMVTGAGGNNAPGATPTDTGYGY
ncbi:MAG TPA: hypothetical protein VMU51_12235 [Mycobacteriales bacterium]|nr:hypothetical protein [Mycobacteriales bacterium]